MQRFWLVASLSALGMAGCLVPPVPPTGPEAPMRHVLRTGPFVFTTDFELGRRDPLVEDLLDTGAEIARVLELPAGEAPIRVVIFSSQQSYHEFFRLNFPELPPRRAFFIKQREGELVVFATRGERLNEDLRHEVTHALLHRSLGDVPLWLDEGLAEYFEVGPDAEGLQRRHLVRLRRLRQPGWQPDLSRLETIDRLDAMTAIDYAESWLWVHFCLEHSDATRSALKEYLASLPINEPGSFAADLAAIGTNGESLARHCSHLTPRLAELPTEADRQ